MQFDKYSFKPKKPILVSGTGGAGRFRVFKVLTFQGVWAASTNTPALANGTGDAGDIWIASDAGDVDFGTGVDISFVQGDWAVYDGAEWSRVEQVNAVISVNGLQGIVNVTPGLIGAESDLSNPANDGEVLVSTTAGVRTWAPKEDPLAVSNGISRAGDTLSVNPAEVDHNALQNYDAAEHAPLDDTATTTTNLWSAEKIQDELEKPTITAAGVKTVGLITDNSDGTLTVSGFTFVGFDNYYGVNADPVELTPPPTDITTISNGHSAYLVARFDDPLTPIDVAPTVGHIEPGSTCAFAKVYRAGSNFHIIPMMHPDGWVKPNVIESRLRFKEEFYVTDTVEAQAYGSDGVRITNGFYWNGFHIMPLNAIDSDTHDMHLHYRTGGTWTYTPITEIVRDQSHTGGGLVPLSADKWATNWIYRDLANERIIIVLSSGDNSLQEAAAIEKPETSPYIDNMCVFVGRIIAQNAPVGTAWASKVQRHPGPVDIIEHYAVGGRELPDQHPISSITGLTEALGKPVTSVDEQFTVPAINGTATGGSYGTLEDSTASWTPDAFMGMVIDVESNGASCSTIISGNTADTLTFDDDLPFETDGKAYTIRDTYTIDNDDLPILLALDTTIPDCPGAVVLPPVTSDNERRSISLYLEAMGADRDVRVVCSGTDRMRGSKWFCLKSVQEAIMLSPHLWGVPHFDVLSTYNIKRFTATKNTTDVTVDSSTWVPVNQNMIPTMDRRFQPRDIGGQMYQEYNSLLAQPMKISYTGQIEKAGGGVGEFHLALRVIDASGTITDYTVEEASTRFASGEGVQNLTLTVPVMMSFRDKIGLIAYRTGTADFIMAEGGYLIAEEF